LSNSERLMKREFESVFERMLYTSGTVNEFFSKVLGSSKEKATNSCCHSCGSKNQGRLNKYLKLHYCHFCMTTVCSKKCLSSETFIIPHQFNLNYDLKPKAVC
jgi:hypothetical protein